MSKEHTNGDGEDEKREQIEQEVSETFEEGVADGNEDKAGYRAAGAITDPLQTVFFNLALFFTRFAPMGQKFWSGLINAGYKGLAKSTGGAEGVGHIIEEGRIKHKPVAYKQDGGEGPIDDPRWITNDGNWFKSESGVKNTYLVAGNVPSIWASSADNEPGNEIKAETAEVLDAGGGKAVFRDAEILHSTVTVEADSDGRAVADGGQTTRKHREHVSIENPGSLTDVLVDLGTEADGRVVSVNKQTEIYGENSDTQEMEQQFLMGELAAKDPGANRALFIKMLLIMAGIIAIIVLGPPLVSALFGGAAGAGGGGGSVIPLTLGLI